MIFCLFFLTGVKDLTNEGGSVNDEGNYDELRDKGVFLLFVATGVGINLILSVILQVLKCTKYRENSAIRYTEKYQFFPKLFYGYALIAIIVLFLNYYCGSDVLKFPIAVVYGMLKVSSAVFIRQTTPDDLQDYAFLVLSFDHLLLNMKFFGDTIDAGEQAQVLRTMMCLLILIIILQLCCSERIVIQHDGEHNIAEFCTFPKLIIFSIISVKYISIIFLRLSVDDLLLSNLWDLFKDKTKETASNALTLISSFLTTAIVMGGALFSIFSSNI